MNSELKYLWVRWCIGLAGALAIASYAEITTITDSMTEIDYALIFGALLDGLISGFSVYVGGSLLLLGIGFAFTPFVIKQYFRAHRAYGYVATLLLFSGYCLAKVPFDTSNQIVTSLFAGLEFGFQTEYIYAAVLLGVAFLLQTSMNRWSLQKQYWID